MSDKIKIVRPKPWPPPPPLTEDEEKQIREITTGGKPNVGLDEDPEREQLFNDK